MPVVKWVPSARSFDGFLDLHRRPNGTFFVTQEDMTQFAEEHIKPQIREYGHVGLNSGFHVNRIVIRTLLQSQVPKEFCRFHVQENNKIGKGQRAQIARGPKYWNQENLSRYFKAAHPNSEQRDKVHALVLATLASIDWLNEKIEESTRLFGPAVVGTEEEAEVADAMEIEDVAGDGEQPQEDDNDDAEDDAEHPEPAAAELVNVAPAMQTDKDGDAEAEEAAEAAMSTHEEVVKAGEDGGRFRHVIDERDWCGLQGWAKAATVLKNQESGEEHKSLFFFNNERCLIPVEISPVKKANGKVDKEQVYITPLEEGVSLPADPVPVTNIYTALKDFHQNGEIKRYYKLPKFHEFVLACKKLLSRYLASAK